MRPVRTSPRNGGRRQNSAGSSGVAPNSGRLAFVARKRDARSYAPPALPLFTWSWPRDIRTTWRPHREWARSSDRWAGFQHFAAPYRLGSRGWCEKGEEGRRWRERERNRIRELHGTKKERRQRERERERDEDGGDFQHAPQPLVLSPPELKKGDRAHHMPGQRESVCQLRRHYVCGSTGPANKCVAHFGARARARARACVRAYLALLLPLARTIGGIGHRTLYEKQSDVGNVMRNWAAANMRLETGTRHWLCAYCLVPLLP